MQDPNEDTEWNDVLRAKGIIPDKPKENEISEDKFESLMFLSLINSSWMKSNEIYINVDSYGLEGLKTSSKLKWPM